MVIRFLYYHRVYVYLVVTVNSIESCDVGGLMRDCIPGFHVLSAVGS